ncbi:MAG: hypothetical protein ACRYGP_15895 [Janthinobacterium lividum]
MKLSLLSVVFAATLVYPAAAHSRPRHAEPPSFDLALEPAPEFVEGPDAVYARRTVLVPETRLVPRTVYVPRTRLVSRTVYVRRSGGDVGYPAGYRYGDATYVPPGISYPCLMGTVGCDSSAVGPLAD